MHELLSKALLLCDILQFEFVFCRPCQSLEQALSKAVETHLRRGLLYRCNDKRNCCLHLNQHRVQSNTSIDSSSLLGIPDDSTHYAVNKLESSDRIVQIDMEQKFCLSQSEKESKLGGGSPILGLDDLGRMLNPFLETYVIAAGCLRSLKSRDGTWIEARSLEQLIQSRCRIKAGIDGSRNRSVQAKTTEWKRQDAAAGIDFASIGSRSHPPTNSSHQSPEHRGGVPVESLSIEIVRNAIRLFKRHGLLVDVEEMTSSSELSTSAVTSSSLVTSEVTSSNVLTGNSDDPVAMTSTGVSQSASCDPTVIAFPDGLRPALSKPNQLKSVKDKHEIPFTCDSTLSQISIGSYKVNASNQSKTKPVDHLCGSWTSYGSSEDSKHKRAEVRRSNSESPKFMLSLPEEPSLDRSMTLSASSEIKYDHVAGATGLVFNGLPAVSTCTATSALSSRKVEVSNDGRSAQETGESPRREGSLTLAERYRIDPCLLDDYVSRLEEFCAEPTLAPVPPVLCLG
jgi:hypothetical protein